MVTKYYIRVNNGPHANLYFRKWDDGTCSFTERNLGDFYATIEIARSHVEEAKTCIIPDFMDNLHILKVTEEELTAEQPDVTAYADTTLKYDPNKRMYEVKL